tara:strand:- start:8861 stop:9268 length:408 start_codon:yes stop_codon:yes gene_type:complete
MSIKKNLSLYINGIIILLAIIVTYLVNKYLDTKIIIEKYTGTSVGSSSVVAPPTTQENLTEIEEEYRDEILGMDELEESKAEYLLVQQELDKENIWQDICTSYNDVQCETEEDCTLEGPGNCVHIGCDLSSLDGE